MKLFRRILVFAFLQFVFTHSGMGQDTLSTILVDEYLKERVIQSDVTHSSPRYVMTIQRLEDLGVRDIGEAFKIIPGVQIRDYGGIGGIKTISYRSLSGNYTNLSFDGIPVSNTQSSVLNLSNFDVFSMKKVAFSTGQPKEHHLMPSLYLSVNQICIDSYLAKPDSFQLNFFQNLTSINAYSSGFNFSSPISDKFSAGIQFISRYGSGVYPFKYELTGSSENFNRENSNLLAMRGRVNIGYNNGRSTLNLTSSYYYNDQQLPGAIILYNPSHDQNLKEKNHLSALNYQWKSERWQLNSVLQYSSRISRYFDPEYLNAQGFIESNYDQRISSAGLMVSRFLNSSNQKIFAGLDLIHSNLESNEFTAAPKRLNTVGVIGAVKWFGKLKLEGNVAVQIVQDRRFIQDSAINILYAKPSPYLAISVLPITNKRFRLRTFYKHTYRVPTFNDLYYNFVGNTNLRPEEAHIFNFGLSDGIQKDEHGIEWTADPYLSIIKDKILAIPTKDIFNWSMQNVGSSRSYGIDLSLSYRYLLKEGSLIISTSHNLNKTIDVSNQNSPAYGHQLPYTPNYSSSLSINYHYKSWGITTSTIYSGIRYALNENIAPNLLNRYADINVGMDKTWSIKKISLWTSIKAMNLLGKNYEIIRSFPMPGRYYQLTIKIKIE